MTAPHTQCQPDIVERLRDRDSVVMAGLFHAIPTMLEAADRIEELTKALRDINDNWSEQMLVRKIARRALAVSLEDRS